MGRTCLPIWALPPRSAPVAPGRSAPIIARIRVWSGRSTPCSPGLASPFLFDQIGFVPAEARPGATDELVSGSGPLPALELVWVPRHGRTGAKGDVITKRLAEAELPGLVAAHVLGLLGSGATRGGQPIGPGDIAVLTRTNRQASAVRAGARARGRFRVCSTHRRACSTRPKRGRSRRSCARW